MTALGHVHLKVGNLERSVAFYRMALARAYERLAGAGVPVNAVDHGISWALYFWDPDDNGVEIYLDRRAEPGGSPQRRGRSRPLSERDIVGRDEGGDEEPEG